jgi:SAM-dependent methyltransferase
LGAALTGRLVSVARVDYEEMASRYDLGRDQPLASREYWREALDPFVDRTRPLLDLGAGTGQWSPLLADWFGVPVLAVEPSSGMQGRAISDRQHPAVIYLRGTAEAIPLADSSVGTAWISAVWHHLLQPHKAAGELRRVVVDGGSVCLRGAFSDSGPDLDLVVLRAFPEARQILDTFPSIAEVTATFESAGFRHRDTRGVQERSATSWREVHNRARQRADTLLRLLPDDVYARRLADLRTIAAGGRADGPQRSTLTLVTFSRL